jgi:UDP-glucose 4-epimerase
MALKRLSKEYFNKEISELFTDYENIIYNTTKIITLFDFFLSGSKVANKFFYNKPIILNLGTGKGYSVDKIVELIEKVSGKKIDVTYLPRRPGDPAKLVAHVDLAKKVLNYRPKHDIMSILQTAYNWHTK